jgi:hypothetical protein
MNKALVLNTDNTITEIDLDIAGHLTSLQAVVQGDIELVALGPLSAYVNEEGKLRGLPINRAATALWEARYGIGTDIILGNVILFGGPGTDGSDIGLTANQEFLVRKLAQNALHLI